MALLDLPQLTADRDGKSGARATQAAKAKLNELYMCWLVLPETQELIAKLAAKRKPGVAIRVDPPPDDGRPHSPGSSVSGEKGHHVHGVMLASPPRSPRSSPRAAPRRSPRQGPLIDEIEVAHRQGAISPHGSPMRSPGARSHSPLPDAAAGSPQQGRPLPAVSVSSAFAGLEPPQPPPHRPHTPTAHHRRLADEWRTGGQRRKLSGEPRVAVPQFFFPKGKPLQRDDLEKFAQQLKKLWEIRKPARGTAATRPSGAAQAPRRNSLAQGAAAVADTRSFTQKTCSELISKGCLFPKWLSSLIFRRILAWEPGPEAQPGWQKRAAALAVHPTNTVLHYQKFKDFYDAELAGKTPERRLFDIIKCDSSREEIVRSDLRPLVEEVLQVHPGLEFLKQTPDFQERYADTVQVRMFFSANIKDDGKLSWSEWERSTLPAVLHALDEESDINVSQRTECFSYEHFYVLYCKFWELDSDHDCLISKEDLSRYGGYALTDVIVERIFRGFGRRCAPTNPGKMTYEEFVWFCLCEEDKTSRQSLEFWFRCVDIDGDGVLSGYELSHFFGEQRQRMEASYQETIAWEDIMCQMVDILKPKDPKQIRLSDVKSSRLSGNFFNALFNLNKFIAFEQRDPFAAHAERQMPEQTDWDRFARVEYERMSREAGEEDAALEEAAVGRQWRADAG